MVQAGKDESEYLVILGENRRRGASGGASAAPSADNPIVAHDLFVRVHSDSRVEAPAKRGEAVKGNSARTMVFVGGDHTIIDHAWLWRADRALLPLEVAHAFLVVRACAQHETPRAGWEASMAHVRCTARILWVGRMLHAAVSRALLSRVGR